MVGDYRKCRSRRLEAVISGATEEKSTNLEQAQNDKLVQLMLLGIKRKNRGPCASHDSKKRL